MPPPTPNRNKCLACEFRRFCNDMVWGEKKIMARRKLSNLDSQMRSILEQMIICEILLIWE
jgi:hypothetical protein